MCEISGHELLLFLGYEIHEIKVQSSVNKNREKPVTLVSFGYTRHRSKTSETKSTTQTTK